MDYTEYLTELPIDDKHRALTSTNEELLHRTEQQLERSYFPYDCHESNCDWYGSCNRLKWVWQMESEKISSRKKIADYCRFKKVLGDAFFDALSE